VPRQNRPRQNRVTPFGEIVSVSERGTVMGNRGVLHDEAGHILRPWQVKRWLLCRLEFRGRRRIVMAPNCYTELFFLDEATGLAAGHRPCFECRRQAFESFVEAWAKGNRSARPTAAAMDERLHSERVGPQRSKQNFRAALADLPDGVLVALREDAHLLWRGHLLAWSPGGYTKSLPAPKVEVAVLTPRSTINAIRTGYVPEIHESAKVLCERSAARQSAVGGSPSRR
jgi:hypothetical protein